MLKKLWKDEGGAVVSLELLLILGTLVIPCALAWQGLGLAIVTKVGELSAYVAGMTVTVAAP